MTDTYQRISQLFREKHRENGAIARVAILGPRWAGKTRLLDRLSNSLREQAGARLLWARLNLAAERFKHFDNPARQLAETLLANLKGCEVGALKLSSFPDTLSDLVGAILVELPGRQLLLEIDHLEAVPTYFARTLAKQLHPLLDVGVPNDRQAGQRLGLLVCGSISLHDLLDLHMSGFIHCERFYALTGNLEVKKAFVGDVLGERKMKADEAAVNTLALWTGGERAFIDPVLNHLQHQTITVTQSQVLDACRELARLTTPLPVLRELIMKVHHHTTIRQLVTRSLERNQPVEVPALESSEISVAELSGIFITHEGQYVFRNEMVREILRLYFRTRQKIEKRSGTKLRLQSDTNDVLKLPLHADAVARDFANDSSIWPIIPKLAQFWRTMMPTLQLGSVVVMVHADNHWYRLDHGLRKVVRVDGSDDDPLVLRVASGARNNLHRRTRISENTSEIAYFDGDDDRLAVGVPLASPNGTVAIITTVLRHGRGLVWSEPVLENWFWFLRHDPGANLILRAIVEVLQHVTATVRPLPDLRLAMESVATQLEQLQREIAVQATLERTKAVVGRWSSPILENEDTRKNLPILDQLRSEWASIRGDQLTELKACRPLSPDLQKHVTEIARAAENLTTALERNEIANLKEWAKKLHSQLRKAVELARDSTAKLKQIILTAKSEIIDISNAPAHSPISPNSLASAADKFDHDHQTNAELRDTSKPERLQGQKLARATTTEDLNIVLTLDEIEDALKLTFQISDLEVLVRKYLPKALSDIVALPEKREVVVANLVDWASKHGMTLRLLFGAADYDPNNPRLAQLVAKASEGVADTPSHKFGYSEYVKLFGEKAGVPESLLLQRVQFSDVLNWLSKLTRICCQVCRIEPFPDAGVTEHSGTGFLIAPDIVLTNWHIAQHLREQTAKPQLRFDYRKEVNGRVVPDGREVAVSSTDPVPFYVASNGLDFALVRLAEPCANDMVAGERRGTLRIKWPTSGIAPRDPLIILQHPSAEPLKLAIGSVIEASIKGKQYAMSYDVNTDGGSSGGPVLTSNLQICALHHYGAQNANHGIRTDEIIAALRENHRLGKLNLTSFGLDYLLC